MNRKRLGNRPHIFLGYPPMLKLKCLLFAAVTSCISSASAEVIPGREGVYVGVLSATLSSLSSAQSQKIKENVILFVAPSGEFFIGGETIEVNGIMNANIYHGVGNITNAAGVVPLHFS